MFNDDSKMNFIEIDLKSAEKETDFSAIGNLSPYKFTTYLFCPKKYELTYIKRIDNDRDAFNKIQFKLNNVIRRTLKDFHLSRNFREASLADINNIYRSQFSKLIAPPDLKEVEQFYTAGLGILERYFEFFKKYDEDADDYIIDEFIKSNFFSVRFNSKVDRVDLLKNGKARIVVIKYNLKQPSVQDIENDYALKLTYLICKDIFTQGIDSFLVYYINSDYTYNLSLDIKEEERVKRVIYSSLKNINDKKFNPKKSVLCSWCDYQENCSAWDGLPKGLYKKVREDESRMGLSYSRLMLFKNCPRAYKKIYIDKISPKPKAFFSIGSTIHSVLEHFHSQEEKLSMTKEVLKDLYNFLWINKGYSTKEQEMKYYNDGLEWLNRYYDKFVKGKERKAEMIEAYFEFEVGKAKNVLIGYIDRIDKENGEYVIYDYKTDPVLRTQKEVDQDLQLTIYYAAAKKNYNLDIKKLGLIFMRFNEIVYTTRTEDDLKKLDKWIDITTGVLLEKERLIKEEDADENKIFPASVNKYCGGCDFLEGCPLKTKILIEYKNKIMNLEPDEDIDLIDTVDGPSQQSLFELKKKKKNK